MFVRDNNRYLGCRDRDHDPADHDARRRPSRPPATGSSPPRSRCSSSRATSRPGSRTSPAPRASPPARSTRTSATSASCCSPPSRPAVESEVETLLEAAEHTPPRDLLAVARLAHRVPRRRPSPAARRGRRRRARPGARRAAAATRSRTRHGRIAAPRRPRQGRRHHRRRARHRRAHPLLPDRSRSDRSSSARSTLPTPDPDQWAALIERLLDAAGPTEEARMTTTAPAPTTEQTHTVPSSIDTTFTWDYDRTRPALGQALREGEDVAVERHDRPRLVDRRRPREGRGGAQRRHDHAVPHAPERRRLAGEALRREGVERGRRPDAELAALAVPARRAGRAALHRPHRRDGAVDRRQVLRVDAGDGRGPPRRGVRQVPRTRS